MDNELIVDLRDQVAVVTGGSRGIGRATVKYLGEAGAHVVINYLGAREAAEEAAEIVRKRGRRALTVQADVSRVSEAAALIEAARSEFGRIDILVCNAGVWRGAPVEEISEELWNEIIDVNLKGTWAVCRAVVPVMKAQGVGRIVIVSSTAGQRGEANVSNYAASKGGQISFAKSLAVELADDGITVNAVAPGWVETEMNTEVFGNRRREIEATIPLRQIATPDDIALPIVFLCSSWARHITGEVLNINGGSVLCG